MRQTNAFRLEAVGNMVGEWLSFRRAHPRTLLSIQLAGTLLILALLPSNVGKTIALLTWWMLTFGRVNAAEAAFFVVNCVLFTVLNVGTLRAGAFAFAHPDALGMPWYEFFMWGFYLLHMGRMVGHRVFKKSYSFGLVICLAVVFALAFMLAPTSATRFLATLAALALALCFFHERSDFLRAGYMVLLGAAIEYTGVWSGQWAYPGSPPGGVPFWSAPMWAGIGLFAGRLDRLPLIAFMSVRRLLSLRPLGSALVMVAGEMTALWQVARRPERENMSDAQSVGAFDAQGAPDGALSAPYASNAQFLGALLPPGGHLLDLGCGSGRFAIYLAGQRPDVTITGLDISPAMIEGGRKNVRDAGLEERVHLRIGDMTSFDHLAPKRVDAVSSVYSLHHLPDFEHLDECLAAMARLRARTGCAIWIFDHARPRSRRTPRLFAEIFTPQASQKFRRDSVNSLLASFSCSELSGHLEAVMNGWHHRVGNLPLFQVHWLPAAEGLPTCNRFHMGQRACPAAQDFARIDPQRLTLRTNPCPLYASCKGGN